MADGWPTLPMSRDIQVNVRAFPDKGGKWQISNNGGTYPMWSRNGHELFFEALDNHVRWRRYAVKGESLRGRQARVWSGMQVGGSRAGERIDLRRSRQVALIVETSNMRSQTHVIFSKRSSTKCGDGTGDTPTCFPDHTPACRPRRIRPSPRTPPMTWLSKA